MDESVGSPVSVRDAREEDIPAIADVLVAAYRQYADPSQVPPDQRDEFGRVMEGYLREIGDVRSRWAPGVEHILAERAGALVGAVVFYPDAAAAAYSEAADHKSWPRGWSAFRLLGVDPAARGLGVGRILTDECIRRAKERGAPTIGLHTTVFMAVAQSMYERMGFSRAPEFDFRAGAGITVMAYKLAL